MKKGLKTYGTWCFLLLLIYVSGFYLIERLYNQQVLQQHEVYLEQKANLLLHLTEKEDNDLTDLASFYVKDSQERVTLLDASGVITFDTITETESENRKSRPEIKAVLSGNDIGIATRLSPTLNETMLYVALPIKEGGKIKAILRLAEPVANFLPNAQKIKQGILLVFTVLWCLLSGILLFILYRRNRPVETILPVIHKMLETPDQPETILATSSQWEDLYQSINQLGQQLSLTYQASNNNEKQLYQLLNDLQIGVFMIDGAGQLLLMNQTMQEQLGTHFEKPQPFATIIQDNRLIQMIYHVDSDMPFLQEERTISKTQRLLDLTLRYAPETERLLGLSYDLTRVRQLEKVQQDFVSNVSHELKTPVTSLIGFSETLLDGAKDDPETLTEFLQIMHKDALRLQHLIQDIIQLSKDAEIDYPIQVIDTVTSIQTVLADYEGEIQAKNLKVTLASPKSLPFATKEKLFTAIFKNLLENAIHYSYEKGVIHVTLVAEKELVLAIADQGIGIAKEEQARIFERFYRVDKARSRNSGGTGLGLAIVKDHVEALHGTITVDSHLGAGATFQVVLPPLGT